MAVSLVQKTSQGAGSAGVTNIPSIAASTAGTTLVAVLVSLTGGTAFTQTTGTGWTRRAQIALSTTVRAELWTFENNPGGITTAQWTSGTAWVNGEISEWTGTGTVTLDGTPGTGTAGAVASLALTNGSANQAGDAGIGVFGINFSGSQAGSSWSTPSGWTPLATANASTQPRAFASYYKTGLPAATLGVTGTYSAATGITGWAGIIATLKDTVAGLAVTTASPLPAGTSGTAYSQALATSGGTGSGQAYSLASGSLPPGLAISTGGVLSGTPATAGTYTPTFSVTDSGGNTATKTFSVTINPAAGQVASLVGIDVARGTWPANNAIYGPSATHLLFGATLPASFDPDGTPANVTVIQCYKTQDTNVAAYVKSVPGNRQVILVYFQEPEGGKDFTLGSTFVAQFKAQSNLIRAQGRPNVQVAMCSAGYPYRNGGDPQALAGNYLRGLGPYVDMFLRDVYQGSAGTGGFDWPSNGLANYVQFQNWLSLVTDPSVVGTIQPLGIKEYGVDSEVGNAARLARIQLDHDYLVSAFNGGPVSAFPLQMWCYWCQSIDVNDAKFTDAATIALWSSFESPPSSVALSATGVITVAGRAALASAGGSGGSQILDQAGNPITDQAGNPVLDQSGAAGGTTLSATGVITLTGHATVSTATGGGTGAGYVTGPTAPSAGTSGTSGIRSASQVLSTFPDGSDPRWLGELGIVGGLRYSSTRPGGDDQMSATLNCDPVVRVPALDPGRSVSVYRGASRVWQGKMSEPVQQAGGWQVTAYGQGAFGSDYRDVYDHWNLNEAITQAIGRGLPWTNPGISTGYLGQKTDSGSQTITDFLNSLVTSPPQVWSVGRDSVLRVGPVPTAVTRLLVATTPPGRTITADVNTLWLKYTAADNKKGKITYAVTTVASTARVAKHGVIEDYADITGLGVLSAPQAQQVGSDILAKYQRAPYSTPFTVVAGQYLSAGGVPVDLGCEQAGEVARLLVTDSPYGGEVTMGPVQFMVGGYEWDEDSQTGTVTPYMSWRTDLAQVLTAVSTRRRH